MAWGKEVPLFKFNLCLIQDVVNFVEMQLS